MKKIFVLCLCFCLLSSQNVCSVTNIDDVDQSLTDEKKQKDANIISDNESGSSEKILKDDQKDTQEKNVSENTLKENTESVTSTISVTADTTAKDLELNKEKLNDADEKLNDKQPVTDTGHVTANNIQKNNDPIQNTPDVTSSKIEPPERDSLSFDDKIRINEILANPDGTDSGNEFIELYNDSNTDISLENWCLYDKTQKCYDFGEVTIQSKDFLTLYNKADFSFSLNNSDEEIYLKDADDNIISEYSYAKSTSGLSWNHDDAWYEESPTPDTQNNENPLTKEYPHIIINEILPNPSGDEAVSEFIEIYNPNDISIELQGWLVKDASQSGQYIFPQKTLAPHSYLTVYRSSFGFALNNSGDETVSLIAPNTQIKSTISYESAPEDLSYNYDTPNWYWEIPTPDNQNAENPLTKDYPDIYLNEILPNPIDDENTDEFIELYNSTNEPVSLKNWIIKDASQTGSYTFNTQEIAPRSYFVIYRSDFGFALNNSGSEIVSLIAPNNKVVSLMSYSETREGISLNRDLQWYFAEATPLAKNADNPKTKQYSSLQLSEILPNPIGNENTDEFIEIYNPNNQLINLKYWTLRDASKTGSYTFTTDMILEPKTYITIYRHEFKFALNNSTENVSLIAPNEKIMSSVSYESSKENVSYNYHFTSKKWRWSKHLTPNKKNIFNNLPIITTFDIDTDSYKNVYTSFESKATDKDNEKLKVRWDFGDGRKSYLWKTQHKYTDEGIYHGHLRVQDGSEEIIKNFTVIVKKYPKHKMKITKIVPNPAGKDSGNEYIIIKNKSKKKINLKNWSIATGSSDKKIVNHPINKKLIIKPGKTKMITKKYAAISLPNKTGVIEIRRPNGSVADTKEYGDKLISIPDNASYEEIDGVWQWLIPQDLEKIVQTNAIIMQALKNEQILSQQILESYVAFDAIYNPPEETNDTHLHTSSFIAKILQKINLFLNTAITQIQTALHNRSQPMHITYTTPIYNIPHTENPCEQPTIFTSNTLHFCQ